MATYRAYLLNPAGKITWGEWFEAESIEEAERIARSRCTAGVPMVELWRGRDLLGRFTCGEREVRPPGKG